MARAALHKRSKAILRAVAAQPAFQVCRASGAPLRSRPGLRVEGIIEQPVAARLQGPGCKRLFSGLWAAAFPARLKKIGDRLALDLRLVGLAKTLAGLHRFDDAANAKGQLFDFG